ncbi:MULTISPECIES: hypothetical protein [Streptomyces]|uniref:Uncharacterized protein n=1 Tax=Streptomyces stelliscabiei TaxID=146820 RepID=A0A8I0PAC9_9ACTN|nr:MULTISPECIES: hypothetical protein [Streptomyces]KND28339.1 hypothetical protein IQ64_44120 [Streptomyces stelliscabiei]MBE1600009.1 hypothetical protein [Streptomyces stelliscabiei]MDX2515826.1 hypothetical protein [Streptomyces stelliscabiei]MDX2549405.1 hypothetical protein [Streptomyces stelliscabiei]MDX2611427.1 hypothetical protein [Streptomyces stelliscabiei]
MALSIAEQRDAANIVATCTRLLELDVIWTTNLEQGVPEGKTDASRALIKVGLDMATGLGRVHERVSLLHRFADELEVLFLEEFDHFKGWTLDISPTDVPALLHDAAKGLDGHASAEIRTLLTKIEGLEGGQAVQGDLPRKMRGWIYIVCAAVSLGLGTLAAAGGGPLGIALGAAGLGVALVLLQQGLSDVHA